MKSNKRRNRWEWNLPLLIGTVVIAVAVIAGGFFSYHYFSQAIGDEFRLQAERAEEDGRVGDQLSWLHRSARLHPEDTNTLVKIARITDDRVNQTPRAQRRLALNASANAISVAIGRLGASKPEVERELRERLIKRYVEIGGSWSREVESEIITLNPPINDPLATKQLAMALARQTRDGYYSPRTVLESGNHWEQLASRQPSDVVLHALDLQPKDLDLLSILLDLELSGDVEYLFELNDGKSNSALAKKLSKRIAVLEGDDRSRAMLIKYRFESLIDPAAASERLAAESEVAFNRLAALKATSANDTKIAREDSDSNFWDFVLISRVLRLTEDSELADRYSKLLFEVGPDIAETRRLEVVYLLQARQLANRGLPDQAISLIKEGLEELGEERLGLLTALAKLKIAGSWNAKNIVEPSELENLNKTLTRVKEAAEAASLNLAKTARLYDAETQFNRDMEVDIANWRINVLQALLDAGAGNYQKAIKALESSLASNLNIDEAEKLDVYNRLYELHNLAGNADLAAAILDQALLILPQGVNKTALLRQAAYAWEKSGNHLRAQQHWQELGDTDMFAKLQLIRANARYNLSLPEELQDLNGVRLEAEEFLIELQQASTSDSSIKPLARQLEFFLITLPPDKVGLAEFRKREDTLANVILFAKKCRDDSDIQSRAAVLLAASGKQQLAEEILAGISDDDGEDRLLKSLTRAKILATRREWTQAAGSLIDASRTEESATVSARMLRAAANYAQLGGNTEIAYQAINKISEAQQTYNDLFLAASIGKDLPTGAMVEGKQLSAEETFDHWKSKLREKEGDDGADWQLLEAKFGIRQLFEDKSLDRDDPAFLEIKKTSNRLLLRRPAWGEAISLAGWVAAYEGRSTEAIRRLRSGISAGDRSSETRALLWGELYLAGRDREANQDIANYGILFSSTNADQGSVKDAIGIARAAVEDWPRNLRSHLVLARIATTIASRTKYRTERKALLDEAKVAIDNANSLMGSNARFAVFSAELVLAVQGGDRKEIEQVLGRAKSSELTDYDKSILLALGNLELRNLKVALEHAMAANNLRTSKRTKLILAAIYQSQKNWDGLVSVLRQTLQVAPNDRLVKRQLQQALVLRGGDIDWKELSDLQDDQDRLSYAILLITTGQAERQIEGEQLLRDMVQESGYQGLAATRVLGSLLLAKATVAKASNDSTQLKSLVEEAIENYNLLLQRDPGSYQDLVNFADFLLKYSGSKHEERIVELLDQISEIDDASFGWLSISLRLADLKGQKATSPETADQWLARAKQGDVMTTSQILIGGSRLLNQNQLKSKALEWVKQAYDEQPQKLVKVFVDSLTAVGQIENAVQVCISHYQANDHDVNAAILLANLLFSSPTNDSLSCQRTLDDALQRYPNNILLSESVGTLRMQQQEFNVAAELLERARSLCREQNREVSPVTLNNLAMLYSQISGSEAKGLEPIQTALKNLKAPELLDTLGAVRLAMGEPEVAEKIFRGLVDRSKEPRYQFHLCLALLAQNKMIMADEEWKKIDFKNLDETGLTSGERNRLDELTKEFDLRNVKTTQQEAVQ